MFWQSRLVGAGCPMRRLRLIWLLLGVFLGIFSSMAAKYLFSVKASTVALVLTEPGLAMLNQPDDEEIKLEEVAEKLRDRDNLDHSYGVKMALACGLETFEFRMPTDSYGQVWIPIEAGNADGIQCLIKRAQSERIEFSFQDYIL